MNKLYSKLALLSVLFVLFSCEDENEQSSTPPKDNDRSFDIEHISEQIAVRVIQKVDNTIDEDSLTQKLLPLMERIDDFPSDTLADKTTEVILNTIDSTKLYNQLYPLWIKFQELDSNQLLQVTVPVVSFIEEKWINEENFTKVFLPITQKIDETPLRNMSDLAKEATAKITVIVNQVNTTFPSLGLAPNYEQIESIINASLVTAKPVISSKGAEVVANELAVIVINQFFSHEQLTQTFYTILETLQQKDGNTFIGFIANWVDINLDHFESEISTLLSALIEAIDPNASAEKIASSIINLIDDKLTEELVYQIVYDFLSEIGQE
ncbi:hypothetical protein [Sediminitomix flava]|uniref:Uncharacterized protein n=1 Tax=Sediminitomix flava TaxID=379075 RepID=A0A315ZGD2_SEDFL|nr:hypothetical protein [Sediminitomix flava]PWJ44571.1 hypothetical protein BC781_101942 [Sediminitomix flava]